MSNNERKGRVRRAGTVNMAQGERRHIKGAWCKDTKIAILNRIDQGVSIEDAFKVEKVIPPKRVSQTLNKWRLKFKKGAQDAYIPPGHMSSKGPQHPALVAKMLEIVTLNPRITLTGLYLQTRKTQEWRDAAASKEGKSLSQQTLERYWQERVKPLMCRKQQAADHKAAAAFVEAFRAVLTEEQITTLINTDESLWYIRYPGKAASGAATKIDGPAIGMVFTSWGDARLTEVSVATSSKKPRGMAWADVPNVVKTDSPTYWVSRDSVVDHIRHHVMQHIGPAERPMLVMDNCSIHAAGLAREAAWAKYLGQGGAHETADGTIWLMIPRGFEKPSEARVIGDAKMDVDTVGEGNVKGDDDYSYDECEQILNAAVDADYKMWSDKLRTPMRKIFLFDGHVCLRILFLPPNTSSLLQPCDLSIFGPLKKGFREWVKRRYENDPNSELTWEDALKEVTYKDALTFLNQYCSNLTTDQVKKGWHALMG